MPLRQ
jgi:hypothetical protein